MIIISTKRQSIRAQGNNKGILRAAKNDWQEFLLVLSTNVFFVCHFDERSEEKSLNCLNRRLIRLKDYADFLIINRGNTHY